MKRHQSIALIVLLLGLLAVALVGGCLLFWFIFGPNFAVDGSLPLFTAEQIASAHDGYQRTTLTSGNEIYVGDYEESALQLVNSDFTNAVGRFAYGGAKIWAIPGQPPSAYVAGDCGSEMPSYIPYRNIKQPPFDWRTATFREMTAFRPDRRNPYLTTTNAALLAEIVRNLRDGATVNLSFFPFTGVTNLSTIKMASDQLPGLLFCPTTYTDAHGQIYLAESIMMDSPPANPQLLHARWIPASPTLTEWLKSP